MDTETPDVSFKHIISVIFNNWTGLKLALEHGMGGPSQEMKVMQLIDEITEKFAAGNFEWDVLADLLQDVMDTDFATILEDNSCNEIGYQLWELYQLYTSQRLQEIMEFLTQLPHNTPIQLTAPPTHMQQVHQAEFPVDLEGDSHDSDEDDGWTVVKRR